MSAFQYPLTLLSHHFFFGTSLSLEVVRLHFGPTLVHISDQLWSIFRTNFGPHLEPTFVHIFSYPKTKLCGVPIFLIGSTQKWENLIRTGPEFDSPKIF